VVRTTILVEEACLGIITITKETTPHYLGTITTIGTRTTK